MASTPYTRGTDFSAAQAAAPSDPLNGAAVDAEFDNVKIALDSTQQNLSLIQRDDGELGNQTVGRDQLKPSLLIGLDPPTVWSSGVNYVVNNTVFVSDGSTVKLYYALVSHTSTDFATDLGLGYWLEYVDLTPPAVVGTIPISGGGTGATTAAGARTNLGLGALATEDTVSIALGGTGANNAAAARTNLGLGIGTQVQAQSSILSALAALSVTADKLPYGSGTGAFSLTDFTSFARTLVAQTSAANVRTALGLVIGTNVQAFNALLADIAGLTLSAGDILYFNGTDIVNLGAGSDGEVLTLASGAPTWAAASGGGWEIEDGAGGSDPFYDFAVDGAVASIETPNFADGFEYKIVFFGLSTSGSVNVTLEQYLATSGAYGSAQTVYSSIGAGFSYNGEIEFSHPRVAKTGHSAIGWFIRADTDTVKAWDNDSTFSNQFIANEFNSTSQKIGKARIAPASGTIDAGKAYLLKRATALG